MVDADSDLLFAVIALQNHIIDEAELVAAFHVWVTEKATPIGRILIERGMLSVDDQALVQALVNRHLKKHDGDVHASLGAAAGAEARDAIRSVGDAELRKLLSSLPAAADYVSAETVVPTLAPLAGHDHLRYSLTRVHADGGLGRVWLARDKDLNREVALKEIRPDQAMHPEAWRRFLREAQVTGQLEHPNIVPVYELGRRPEDDQPFYTMRFVRGRTMRQAIADYHQHRIQRKLDPLELPGLLQTFVSVCQAIAYAHSRGVIHRDLKPENVVLGGFGEVLVLDWGLAKTVDELDHADDLPRVAISDEADGALTRTGSRLGTPSYMSPEQASGRLELIDARTDVYGLGAILFEVLTGNPPHEGATTNEVLSRIIDGPTPLARSVEPTVPRPLEAISSRAMAKARTDRYGSASDLATDVQRWLADEPVSVYREPCVHRIRRWVKRNRTPVAAVAAASFVALILATAGQLWIARQRGLRMEAVTRKAELALQDARRKRASAVTAPVVDLAVWNDAIAAARRTEDLISNDEVAAATRAAVKEFVGLLTTEHERVRTTSEAEAKDRLMLERLAEIRTHRGGEFDAGDPEAEYFQAFQDYGIDVDRRPTKSVAEQIRNRPLSVATELIAALDDWAEIRGRRAAGRSGGLRLIAAATEADTDAWRNRLRSELLRPKQERRSAVRELAASRPESLPVPSVLLLAQALVGLNEHRAAVAVLREGQQRHPTELWINYDLAIALEIAEPEKREDVVRFLTAARALRPDTAHKLAHALQDRGEIDAAVAMFRDLARRRPDVSTHHMCLAIALQDLGNTTEALAAIDLAVEAGKQATSAHPNDAEVHGKLGTVFYVRENLVEKGGSAQAIAPPPPLGPVPLGPVPTRFESAIAELRRAVALNPRYAEAHHSLGLIFHALRQYDTAADAYRTALYINPNLAVAHAALGNLYSASGDLDEAIAEYERALVLNPDSVRTRNDLKLALLDEVGYASSTTAQRRLSLNLSQSKQHFLLGIALYSKGEIDAAIVEYKRALILKPDDVESHYSLGSALLDKGELQTAAAEYKAALTKTSVVDCENKLFGTVLRAFPGPPGIAYSTAASFSRQLDAGALKKLGLALRDPNELTAQSDGVVRKNPSGDGTSARSRVIPEQTRPERRGSSPMNGAEVASNAAVPQTGVVSPAFWEHVNRGLALEQVGDRAGSERAYKQALAVKPDLPDLYHRIGMILREDHQRDASIAAYRRAVALKPEFAEAHVDLGYALDQRGDRSAALAEYGRALALESDLAAECSTLGDVFAASESDDRAIEFYRKSLALEPNVPKIHARLGRVQYRAYEYQVALSSFQRALVLDRNLAEAHYGLGLIRDAYDAHDEAINEFRTALRLKPDLAEASLAIGVALGASGRIEEAIEQYKQTLVLKPDDPYVYLQLGLTLEEAGRFSEAVVALKKGNGLGGSRLTHRSLRWLAECERWLRLEEKLTALTAGKLMSVGAADRLELAALCHKKKQFVKAAQFCKSAFDEAPALANDTNSRARYNAACAAALAGCGVGEDAPPPDDARRAAFRAQALAWLRDELSALRPAAGIAPSESRPPQPTSPGAVQAPALTAPAPTPPRPSGATPPASTRMFDPVPIHRLNHMKNDVDLAGIRKPDALSRLPGQERAAWQRFWRDVEDLRRDVEK
jgi:tetratricopeptide (TPR) repeat protein